MARFAAIALGTWIGKPGFNRISLGSVGGTLVAVAAIGQWRSSGSVLVRGYAFRAVEATARMQCH